MYCKRSHRRSEARGEFAVQLCRAIRASEGWSSPASRFATACRLFAPVYRQTTLRALLGSDPTPPAAHRIAYSGVRAAWREYVQRWSPLPQRASDRIVVGCSTFDCPPPQDALFGRFDTPRRTRGGRGVRVLCVNPAA